MWFSEKSKSNRLENVLFTNRIRIQAQTSKTGACIYGDWKNWTRKQIEYISRGSNSAKTKDQNSNIPIKAGSSELVKQL